MEQVSRTFGLHSEKEVYTHFATKNPIKDQESSLTFFPHRGGAASEEGVMVAEEEIGSQYFAHNKSGPTFNCPS